MTSIRSRKVTLRDVAQVARVHPSTASRILSGSRNGDPDAARRIQEAARALGYRTNQIARALRQRQTTIVGMVIPDLTNPYFPALVKSIEQALNIQGYALLLGDSQNDAAIEAQRIEALVDRQVDGLIVSPVHMNDSAPGVKRAAEQVPVVQVDRRVPVSTDFVGVDQDEVIALAVNHLQALGRRHITFLSSSDSVSTIAERTAAFRRRLADPPTPDHRILFGDLTLRWGIEAVSQLLLSGERLPDALVCANDLIALGALQRLRQARVRVPEQIAIIGVDNTEFGQVSEPELTTVRQPVGQLGSEAVGMLLSHLHATPEQSQIRRAARSLVLAPDLLVRRSAPSPTGTPVPQHRAGAVPTPAVR